MLKSYIDGHWVEPQSGRRRVELVNPATEQITTLVPVCEQDDVDRAVRAARRAFQTYGLTSLAERTLLMRRLIAVFERRYDEMVMAITTEMGAPVTFSRASQAASGLGHLEAAIRAGEALTWERPIEARGKLVLEPIGVAALITPWNWPINQLAAKIGPALLAGCTLVVKPSELAPLSAQLLAEFIAEAGYAPGIFNMLHGTGLVTGDPLVRHPEVDMVSFTGSTRAGIQVAKAAADGVKRVSQELGGKSANIIFADADLPAAVRRGILNCFSNSGQSCNAPTRMLVEQSIYEEAVRLAVDAARSVRLGDPLEPGQHLGPVISRTQFGKIQRLIQAGIDEGARLIVGGPGKPVGFERGFYVRPTIFADVTNQMTIAREEIFGPVLSLIPFADLEDAINLANDSPFGLAAYVQTGDPAKAEFVARRLRAGSVHINDAEQGYDAPFGGYKQSGNGREYGVFGLQDYLEYKVINGFYSP